MAPVSGLAEDIQAREYDKAMPMMSRDLRFRPKALEVLSRSFVELEVLPAAPDMKTLYTEQFLPAAPFMTGTNRLIQSHSHWGAFLAEVEDGRVVGVRPFARDSDPSPLLQAMPAAVHSPMRIAQPMVREGWLANGPGASEGRGRELFVPVSWERALDLVAGELRRVRDTYGHSAIMGGSQGWGSAGIFHDARTNVRRFLAAFGGFVDQASNYSFGAALTFLPHILGSAQAVSGPLTSWSSIARHGRLVVLFGGANPKNTQVMKGGCGVHTVGAWMQELGRVGVEVVNVSPIREDGPEAAAATWIPIRPNTDTAMLLALVHTLIAEGLHDQAFLASHCTGFERVQRYVMGESDGQPKDADWAAAICGVAAETIRALARRMAATRTHGHARHGRCSAPTTASSRIWAVVAAGGDARPDRLAGRRLRFRLWLGSRHCRAAAGVRPPDACRGAAQPARATSIPVARIADCCCTRRGVRLQRQEAAPIRTSSWSTGPAAIRSTITRTSTGCAAPGGGPTPSSCTSRGGRATARHADIVLPATTTLERNDIGASQRDRYMFAMQQAIEPVGEARNDYDIFARARASASAASGLHAKAATRWSGCAISTTAGATAARQRRSRCPISTTFWKDGLHRDAASAADEYVHVRRFPRRSAGAQARDAVGPDRDLSPSASPASATTTARRIRPGWSRPNGSGRRPRRYPLHLMSSQPRYRLHSQLDPAPVSARGKVAGREPICDQSGRRGGARHRRWRCGARAQRSRRVPRRRAS